ncbi:hypothetical protein JCM6882_007772 [Rhodosporidiobolus microsporus]
MHDGDRAIELRGEARRYSLRAAQQQTHVGEWENALYTYEEQYPDIRNAEMAELHAERLRGRATALDAQHNAAIRYSMVSAAPPSYHSDPYQSGSGSGSNRRPSAASHALSVQTNSQHSSHSSRRSRRSTRSHGSNRQHTFYDDTSSSQSAYSPVQRNSNSPTQVVTGDPQGTHWRDTVYDPQYAAQLAGVGGGGEASYPSTTSAHYQPENFIWPDSDEDIYGP